MSSWLSEREQRLVAGAEAVSAATPIPTQIVSNGEYLPPPQSETQKRVEQRMLESSPISILLILSANRPPEAKLPIIPGADKDPCRSSIPVGSGHARPSSPPGYFRLAHLVSGQHRSRTASPQPDCGRAHILHHRT